MASLTQIWPGRTSTSCGVENVPDGTTSLAAAAAAVVRVIASSM
jgi:hypothetical protein